MREKEKCRKGNVQYFCMYTAGFLAAALLLLLIFAKEHASFTKMADGVAQHYAVRERSPVGQAAAVAELSRLHRS